MMESDSCHQTGANRLQMHQNHFWARMKKEKKTYEEHRNGEKKTGGGGGGGEKT